MGMIVIVLSALVASSYGAALYPSALQHPFLKPVQVIPPASFQELSLLPQQQYFYNIAYGNPSSSYDHSSATNLHGNQVGYYAPNILFHPASSVSQNPYTTYATLPNSNNIKYLWSPAINFNVTSEKSEISSDRANNIIEEIATNEINDNTNEDHVNYDNSEFNNDSINREPYIHSQFLELEKATKEENNAPVIAGNEQEKHEVNDFPIISQYRAQDDKGAYHFGYSGGSSSRSESRNHKGIVTGSYGIKDPSGEIRRYHYVADNNGFRITGPGIPNSSQSDSIKYDTSRLNEISERHQKSGYASLDSPFYNNVNTKSLPDKIVPFSHEQIISPDETTSSSIAFDPAPAKNSFYSLYKQPVIPEKSTNDFNSGDIYELNKVISENQLGNNIIETTEISTDEPISKTTETFYTAFTTLDSSTPNTIFREEPTTEFQLDESNYSLTTAVPTLYYYYK